MDNRPIGVFDSGLGGLTAVRELRRILPDENIIYFGDTGRMPYGGRPREQMRKIARQNIAFAESFGVKVILAACGTISSNAADILAANTTRTVGVLAPGAEMLAETGKKTLGVIATKTSIESGAFQTEISRRAPDVIALASAMDGEPVGFAQVLHKALRGCIGRADKDNVRAEVCAYRV